MPITTNGRMSIAEIVRLTGWQRDALNGFLAKPEIREWLGGAQTHPEYPESSRELFLEMKGQYEAGVKPTMFAVALKNSAPMKSAQNASEDEAALEPLLPAQVQIPNQEAITAMARVVGGELARVVADVLIERVQAAGIVPPPSDRLLTREQAAELLACAPGAVGRRVRPVLPNTWSHLHIQAYITALRARAESAPPRSRSRRARSKPAAPAEPAAPAALETEAAEVAETGDGADGAESDNVR